MAFGVTPDGFAIKPLETILDEIRSFQLANVDPGLSQDPRDPLQQINQGHGAKLFELWELAQAVYNAAYPDSASDDSLVNVASITGTTPRAATKTLVPGVLVELGPGDSLPQNSVANLTGQANSRFLSKVAVAGSGPGGFFPVDFEAETAGATVVIVGQLDEIAEPVVGWLGVDNPVAGNTGTDADTDATLRARRLAELEAQGSTNVDSIRANLLDDPVQADDARVFENDTDVIDSEGRPPHSVHAVLRGGASNTIIAQSIFDTAAAGIATFGATTIAIIDSMGKSHNINFDIATEKVVHTELTVVTDPQVFDSVDGPAAIKTAIVAYYNSLNIDDDVIYDAVKAVLIDTGVPNCGIPGVVKVTILKIGFVDPPTGVVDLVIGVTEYASGDVANVDLVVT
jgi:hypothetical protein